MTPRYSPLLNVLRISKPFWQNQTEDNLRSNMQETYSSLVMWNTHIRDRKKRTAQTENIESLWEYSLSPGTNDTCCSQKRKGKNLCWMRDTAIFWRINTFSIKKNTSTFLFSQFSSVIFQWWGEVLFKSIVLKGLKSRIFYNNWYFPSL